MTTITNDLTGTWKGDNGSITYLREVKLGTGTLIFWSSSGDEPIKFSNVFQGTRVGKRIIGTWVDVPQTSSNIIGTLSLIVEDPKKIIQMNASHPYGTNVWKKIRNGFPSETEITIDK